MNYYIIAEPHRDGFGNFKMGTVRQLPNGKWIWHGAAFGRSSHASGRKQFDFAEQAQRAAARTLGKVRFEEILE